MKDAFKRLMSMTGKVEAVASAATATDAPKGSVEALMAELAASKAKEAESVAKLAEFSSVLAEVAEMQAASDAVAFAAKMETRKSFLLAAVGSALSASVFEKTKEMSDEHFEVVMEVAGIKQEKEAKNPLFKEQGVEAEADVTKVTAQNGVMNYLTALYAKQ